MGMGGNKKGFSSLKHLKQMKMIIIIFFLVLSGAVVLFYRWQATVLVLLLFLPLFAYNCTLFKNKVLETEKDKLASAMEKLRESARSYAMSLSNLPGMAYRCKYDRKKSIDEHGDEIALFHPFLLHRATDFMFSLYTSRYQK